MHFSLGEIKYSLRFIYLFISKEKNAFGPIVSNPSSITSSIAFKPMARTEHHGRGTIFLSEQPGSRDPGSLELNVALRGPGSLP